MPLYLGDNGVHKFWESTNREVIILKNHREPWWIIFIDECVWDSCLSLRKARKITEKKIKKRLGFDMSHYWYLPRKNARKMVLVSY
jgi:hypothetical protein